MRRSRPKGGNSRSLPALLALAALLWTPLWAAAAEATTWRVARGPSDVGFRVSHLIFSEVEGRFTRFRGTVEVPGDRLEAARIEVEIDVASLRTGHRDRDRHLLGEEFFDAGAFPRMRFVSREVRPAGPDAFQIAGDLTIRDVTREVLLEARPTGRRETTSGPWLQFEATTSLDRRDYGLRWNDIWEGSPLIGDEVEIRLSICLVEAPARGPRQRARPPLTPSPSRR